MLSYAILRIFIFQNFQIPGGMHAPTQKLRSLACIRVYRIRQNFRGFLANRESFPLESFAVYST